MARKQVTKLARELMGGDLIKKDFSLVEIVHAPILGNKIIWTGFKVKNNIRAEKVWDYVNSDEEFVIYGGDGNALYEPVTVPEMRISAPYIAASWARKCLQHVKDGELTAEECLRALAGEDEDD